MSLQVYENRLPFEVTWTLHEVKYVLYRKVSWGFDHWQERLWRTSESWLPLSRCSCFQLFLIDVKCKRILNQILLTPLVPLVVWFFKQKKWFFDSYVLYMGNKFDCVQSLISFSFFILQYRFIFRDTPLFPLLDFSPRTKKYQVKAWGQCSVCYLSKQWAQFTCHHPGG